MGNFRGSATTIEGQEIVITFSADEFSDDNKALPPITNIIMQTDGGAEYSPRKITTLSISFLVDNLELLSITDPGYPVSVEVEDSTAQRILFAGYTVPNSYNQTYTGVNDNITIECVDYMGYAQYIPYAQIDPDKGFACLSIERVLEQCKSLITGNTNKGSIIVPYNINFVRSSEERMSFFNAKLSEEYFFKSNIPDDVTNDYRPMSMSCAEVLDMIAESFHLTWVSYGLNFWLLDMLTLRSGNALYWDLRLGEVTRVGLVRKEIEEGDFAGSACNVSTLQPIIRTTINYERSDAVQVLQNPFDIATLERNSDYVEYYDQSSDPARRYICVKLTSKLYDTYPPLDAEYKLYSEFIAWRENLSVVPEGMSGFPSFLDDFAWGSDGWNVALKICTVDTSKRVVLLRRKAKFSTPAIGQGRGVVKHATRVLTVAAEVVTSDTVEKLCPINARNIDCILYVSVLVDGLYYDPERRTYTSEEKIFRMAVRKDGTAHWKIYNLFEDQEGIPVPGSGTVELLVYSKGSVNEDIGWSIAWLKRLELSLKADVTARRADLARPSTEYVGRWDYSAVQEVSPPLSTYYTLGPRPIYIPYSDYHSVDGIDLIYDVNDKEFSFAEYVHAHSNMGDRRLFELPYRDSDNSVTPFTVFSCENLWKDGKVLAGYTRDILNNSITLTLI